MPPKWKWPKYSKIFKNDQNTPKSKITKIPPKLKKWPKYPWNPKYDQNTLETQKNDQNTPET